ncbi:MAG TPA: VWA domain-containing protein, partial [Piscirickettsiaceae bacterium]|nr:VWA domain-containing protein [Piscirickettsiaceae bacterium]
MFRFEQPVWLLLLVVPPVLAWVWRRLRQRIIQRYADEALLPWVQVNAAGKGRGAVALWALALAWSLWVVALAHPQWGAPKADTAQAVGSDVVILLDLSRSMAVTDVAPSRLGAAKALIDAVAARLPETSRIGLRVFDGHSHWVHGLTTD